MTEETKEARYNYNIKGRKFYQKQLVLGQLELLIDLLKDMGLEKGLTNIQILSAIGNKLPHVMAITLYEEGKSDIKIEMKTLEGMLKKQETDEIKELSNFFANSVDITLGIKVITDFFVCTPIGEVLSALARLIPSTEVSPQTVQKET